MNRLLADLPSAELGLLKPHLRLVELRPHSPLLQAGDEITHAFFPQSGVISIVVNLSTGQTVEVATVGRESLLGASAAFEDENSTHGAIVALPGMASVVEIDQLRLAATRSPAVAELLRRHERALLVQAQHSAACNAVHPVESRLSRWLSRARDRSGDARLALTQDFISRMLGIQRNSVTIAAHALQEAGLIHCSRGHIEIIDRARLAANACECYGEVARNCERLFGRDSR